MTPTSRGDLLAQITEALSQQRTPNAVGELDPQIAYSIRNLAAVTGTHPAEFLAGAA